MTGATTIVDAAGDLAELIEANADDGERNRRLPLPTVNALRDAQLLRMCVPRVYGGPEVDPVTLVRERGVRLLSTDFRAGDLFIFGGFTLHGSLDNCSAVGRVRLSCDVRFQPAADPCDDPRYFGDDPRGSKGGGYGDMRGAQPLA